MSERETLVNGAPVRVATLQHGDTVAMGGRALRWEYEPPRPRRDHAAYWDHTYWLPLEQSRAPRRRSAAPPATARAPHVRLAMHAPHRSSLPASGKQVAIIQPQRRDTGTHNEDTQPNPRLVVKPHRPYTQPPKRHRTSQFDTSTELNSSLDTSIEQSRRRTNTPNLQNTTKATLWIESRKISPRKSVTQNISPRKSSETAVSPNKSLSETLTPKYTPKQTTPKSTPKQTTSKITTPKKGTPKIATPKVTPKTATPEKMSPKTDTPEKLTPKTATPKKATPKTATPKKATPKAATPKKVTPKTTTPKWVTRKSETPKQDTPKTATPKQVLRKTVTPRTVTPRKSAVTSKKSTPLRMLVLRKSMAPNVNSVQKVKVAKIEEPSIIDHTKKAALLLMAGHSPRQKQTSSKTPNTTKSPSYVIKASSQGRKSRTSSDKRVSSVGSRKSKRSTLRNEVFVDDTPRRGTKRQNGSISVLEITDSDAPNSTVASNTSRRSGLSSLDDKPLLPSPKKSAMKDPTAKKSIRKMESIKFDLSNLESSKSHSDLVNISDSTSKINVSADVSGEDITLQYSDTSPPYPSPRRSIHSRISRIMENTFATPMSQVRLTRTSKTLSPKMRESLRNVSSLGTSNESNLLRSITPESPRARKSIRGSAMLQKVLEASKSSNISQKSTRSRDLSTLTTTSPDVKRKTISPRTSNQMESYSLVDLVSMDSDDANRSSVYNSVGSVNSSSINFGTPQTGRKTRSTMEPNLISSSTPYVGKDTRKSKKSKSSPNVSHGSSNKISNANSSAQTSRRSKSLSTPENTSAVKQHISVNSTKISRASKSKSRINDSDMVFIDDDLSDTSPKSSRKLSKSHQSTPVVTRKTRSTVNESNQSADVEENGMVTPENSKSPEHVGTPVLSIQNLLDSSQGSISSTRSPRQKATFNTKRKSFAAHSESRSGGKSKSLSSVRKDLSRSLNNSNTSDGEEKVVTPKSNVKLLQEDVKNKHSSAKKPTSKRSIIDHLDESDIVKQLFNSPVKRKLSQSMTEFSRQHLVDEPKRQTRKTIALGRTLDETVPDRSVAITPEVFVSPLTTPGNSPNLSGVKRIFKNNSPENDLRDVRGVKALLRTPRARRSGNDLTNVVEVKRVFARSPRNRLSDLKGVKKVFASSPNNDLRRITGVTSLFKTRRSPRNDLSDIEGIKGLFQKKTPKNDLRNVSGVKKTMQAKSPKNNLSDLRGVKRVFQREPTDDLNDVSGIEELFNDSNSTRIDTSGAEAAFDKLMGNPRIRATYSKSYIKKSISKQKQRKTKSLLIPLDTLANNVEEWLEQELQARVQEHQSKNKDKSMNKSKNISGNRSKNVSKIARELQNLATNTVEGGQPIRTSRSRNSTIRRSIVHEAPMQRKIVAELYGAHTLPIKKRSLVDSLENSASSSINALPIKKRAIVHSTPVKNRLNITENVSELGRVSPIAPLDRTEHIHSDTTARIADIEKAKIGRPKSGASRKTMDRTNSSQKKTRSSKTNMQSPGPCQTVSSLVNTSKNSKSLSPNSKQLRPKLIIVKKSPVLSPKLNLTKKSPLLNSKPNRRVKESSQITEAKETAMTTATEPKGTRSRRPTIEKETPEKTPKKTSRRAKLPSKLETKNLSPKQSRKTNVSPKKDISPRSTRGRKRAAPTPKKSQIKETTPSSKGTGRGKRKQADTKPNQIQNESPIKGVDILPIPKKTRSRIQKEEEKPKTPKRNTRAKVHGANIVVTKPSPKMKPDTKNINKKTTQEPTIKSPKPIKESPKLQEKSKRTRRGIKTVKQNDSPTKETLKRSHKAAGEPVKSEEVTRKANNNIELQPIIKESVSKARKGRKLQVTFEEPPLKKSKHGANTSQDSSNKSIEIIPRRGRKPKKSESPKKSDTKLESPKRKRNQPKVAAVPVKVGQKQQAITSKRVPAKVAESVEQNVEIAPRRGRKPKKIETPQKSDTKQESPKRRRNQAKIDAVPIKVDQNKQAKTSKRVPAKVSKAVEENVEITPRRGRKTKKVESPKRSDTKLESPKRKKNQPKDDTVPVKTGQKRRAVMSEVIPAKVSKIVEDVPVAKKSIRNSKIVSEVTEIKSTRGRKRKSVTLETKISDTEGENGQKTRVKRSTKIVEVTLVRTGRSQAVAGRVSPAKKKETEATKGGRGRKKTVASPEKVKAAPARPRRR